MSIEEEMEKIQESCKRIYGTTTDGSYEACLHYNGYYGLKKELILQAKEKENQKKPKTILIKKADRK